MFTDRPTPPRNLGVSNIRAESCYLNWDAPTDNGGSELTNYIVERMEVMKEQPELEEGVEAPPEPQWEVVNDTVIERKFGVCFYTINQANEHQVGGILGITRSLFYRYGTWRPKRPTCSESKPRTAMVYLIPAQQERFSS